MAWSVEWAHAECINKAWLELYMARLSHLDFFVLKPFFYFLSWLPLIFLLSPFSLLPLCHGLLLLSTFICRVTHCCQKVLGTQISDGTDQIFQMTTRNAKWMTRTLAIMWEILLFVCLCKHFKCEIIVFVYLYSYTHTWCNFLLVRKRIASLSFSIFEWELIDCLPLQDSDGEKSDDNLVVDVSNEVSVSLFFILL